MRDDPLPRIVVVGSVNMDIAAYVSRFPKPGETLSGTGTLVAPGGKGGNQAIAAARLGARVALIACVGNDDFGQRLRVSLESEGIDCAGVVTSERSASGIAMVMVDDTGNNSIVTVEGSNGDLTPDVVAAHEEALRSAALVLCELTTPMTTVERVLSIASSGDVPVLLNASPVQGPMSACALSRVAFLVVNEVEASMLSGQKLQTIDDAKMIANILHRAGAKHVLITLGARGVVTLFSGESVAVTEFFPASSVEALDTTGAGDTFAGAFAAAVVSGAEKTEAVTFAQQAAAICVTRAGAAPSIPRLHELRERLPHGRGRA